MLLPGSLPDTLGGLIEVTDPPPGARYEIVVLSHAGNFWVPVAVIDRWTAFQFARILKDTGSATLTIPVDGDFSDALFPPGVTALNPNPYFTGGSLAGWLTANGTEAADQSHVLDLPWSLMWTPNGTSFSGHADERGALFACIPGQQYTITANAYSVAGWSPANIGMRWYDPAGNHISDTLTAFAVPAAAWTPASTTLQAPDGAFGAAPLVGSSGTPANTDVLWFQRVVVTYDSGAVTLGDYILDYEHLFQVWYDSRHVFDFLGETITEQQADDSEQRVATIAGPGSAAVLKWGAALPPGFPVIVFKTDSILDGFAEIDQFGNPALDTGLWNEATPLDHIALQPLGTCSVIASTGTTYLGAAPYDITGSSVSAQVLPMTASGLDGSQVTQFYVQDPDNSGNYALIGLSATAFYCRLGDTVAGISPIKKLTAYDGNSDSYWRISEQDGVFFFWTSSDGQNFSLRWQIKYQWDASNIEFFYSATYDEDAGATAAITNINSEVITPTSAGNIFLDTPIMSVWHQLFLQARERGTLSFVSTRADSDSDSYGNEWTDGMSVQVANGTTLYDLLSNQAAIVNADWVMDPGFDLKIGLPAQPEAVSLGRDLSRMVILREADDGVSVKQRTRARDAISNSTGAVNSDGRVVTSSDADSQLTWGIREGWAETAASVNPEAMQIVIDASVAGTKDEVLSQTVTISGGSAFRPFHDYDVGDWVGMERPRGGSVIDVVRVIGIAPSVQPDGSSSTELTINTYREFMQAQLAYLVSKFGGQFIYSLGTTPVTFSSASNGSPPTYISPSIAGLQDVKTG